MSMLAEFVQVNQDLLTQLVGNPSLVPGLFGAHQAFNLPPAALTDAMRQRMQQHLPQMLATSLAGVNPAMREALEKRLGLKIDSAPGSEVADVFVKLMKARGMIRDQHDEQPTQPPGSTGAPAVGGKGKSLSLDKAWHGMHYLLCGEMEPGSTILSQAILGGEELGEDFSGYGAARYFAVEKVAEIARELSRPELEAEMRGRYDPERMTSLGIYPSGVWKREGPDWLLEEFGPLRAFYVEAGAQRLAVVTCLV